MPLPWNTPPQGVLPAQTGVSFHSGDLPSGPYTNGNQVAIQQAIAEVGKFLQERKKDEIANQLLAVDNAPVQTDESGVPKYDPELVQKMITQGTQGKTGQDALTIADEIRKRIQERTDAAVKNAYIHSQIVHNTRDATYGKVFDPKTGLWVNSDTLYREQNKPDPHEGKIYDPKLGVWVTPDQHDRGHASDGPADHSVGSDYDFDALNKELINKHGIGIADWEKIQHKMRVDKDNNPTETGDWFMAEATLPDGRKSVIRIPVGEEAGYRARINAHQAYAKEHSKTTAAAPGDTKNGISQADLDLARKALADPNADALHKQAAQRLLAQYGQ